MAVAVVLSLASSLFAQTSTFKYQGELSDNGVPANGSDDLSFSLYNAATNGTPVGITVSNIVSSVSNGVFTVSLNFGSAVFNGSLRPSERHG